MFRLIAVFFACTAFLTAAEVRPVYVPAAGIVPGVPTEPDHAAPPWIPDSCPTSWPVVDLNGIWKVSAHADESCVDYQTVAHTYGPLRINDLIRPDQTFAGWKELPVPWPESFRAGPNGKPMDFRGVVYYQRQVTMPVWDPTTQEPVLVFCGAGYRTDAWISGRYLGQHLGQWARFEFPLAGTVQPGASASLLVKCINTRFEQKWHGSLTVGLFDPVRIEIRPLRALQQVRTRITPDLGALEVSWRLPSGRASGRAHLTATVSEAASGIAVATVERDIDLADPGFLRLPVAQARRWSPEDPFLHRVTIALDGVEVAIRRFGWRTVGITTDATGKQRLTLNGVPFWMRAFEFDYEWPTVKECNLIGFSDPQRFGFNNDGHLRNALKVMKFANVNTLRPHSMSHFHNETFFNLCDEEGLLVYLDWSGDGPIQEETPTTDKRRGAHGLAELHTRERNLGPFAETIQALHDHPSLAFISFGNEMYDWALPEGYTWDGLIGRYFAILHQADWQRRPGSGSTGRWVWDGQVPVDFVDHHQYIGVYYGSWRDLPKYMQETSDTIRTRFGARLPFVNMETGDVMDFRVHDKNRSRLKDLLSPVLDRDQKQRLVGILSSTDELAQFLRLAVQGGGMRNYLTDLGAYRRNHGPLLVKRYIETFRLQRALTDGVSLNSAPYCLAGRADPDGGHGLQPWPDDGVLRIVDPLWDFRDAFAPVQALMDPANPHPLCGAAAVTEPLTVVNDSLAPVMVAVAARLRHADGRIIELGRLDGISVPPAGLATRTLPVAVPADWPSGVATIELSVLRDGKEIAVNHYDLQVLSAGDRRHTFPRKSVALYEPMPGETSTGAILDRLGIAYQRVVAPDDLGKAQVLIIGANQMDTRLHGAGAALNRWIAAGGRLLCFEQSAAGGVPWAADERVMKLARSTQMEVLASRHPIFAGCDGYMQWTAPGGRGSAIFDTCLDLNDGMLAIASVGHVEDAAGLKAVVSNRRLGKGEYLLSMITTQERYGSDAVVTRYVENCLSYILGDTIAVEAIDARDLGARLTPVMSLENKEASCLDLCAAMNRGLTDETANDGLGGWTDAGKGAQFDRLPRGFHRFDNLMVFRMVQPEQNGGNACIVLKGPGRDQFPEASPPITVGERLERLYFLNTLMWVKAAAGEPVLTYDVTYQDGSKVAIDLRNQVDIADWWMAKDLANAQVLYREGEKGLFCSQWINPRPKDVIASIIVRSRGNAVPIVLAITGKKVFEQRRDKTE